MRLIETKKMFQALGWHAYRAEGVTFAADFHLSDRFVSLLPQIVRLGDREVLQYSPSLYTKSLIDAYQFITDKKNQGPPLINFDFVRTPPFDAMSIEAPEIMEAHIGQASEEAISWAIEQDIDKVLEDCAAWPPEFFGTIPVRHLAALSIQRDEQRLRYYQDRFAAGDNLGFWRKDFSDFIDRALIFAKRD